MWRSEDNSQKLVFSFHCVGLGVQTQSTRFGSQHPYLMSHLASPLPYFLRQGLALNLELAKEGRLPSQQALGTFRSVSPTLG